MLQNHLLQVQAMVGMETPAAINADSIRNEVNKVRQSLQPLSESDLRNNLVLGQYTEYEVRGQYYPATVMSRAWQLIHAPKLTLR